MMNRCAFAGYRPQCLSFAETDHQYDALKMRLRALIIQLIEQKNIRYFLSGMEPGIEIDAAEIVLSLKDTYPDLTLECVIPYETQAAVWPESLRNRYFSIISLCDKESMLQHQCTPDCMVKRNQYLVEHADLILAVWDGQPSGTGQIVWYAQGRGKIVWTLHPVSLELSS
jgi:uncharacterized phage-like protein YoqJ